MKDVRDGLASHLATSPCHLNVQFFHISLWLQKQVWTWGMYVCVRKGDRFESSPDAPEGIRWVPRKGDYIQMVLSVRLELLKVFCKARSMSWFFPLQSSVILTHLLYLALWRQNMTHLLILVQLSSLNQNQKVVKQLKIGVRSFYINFETRN